MSRRRLKNLLAGGTGPLAGPLTSVAEPSFIEACALAGFDFIVLDLEHSTISDADFSEAVRAGEPTGLPVVARLPVDERHRIRHLLDPGGDGIIASNVGSVADVNQMVRDSHFPPLGRRGAGPARTNAQGAKDTAQWVAEENQAMFLGVLIESREGLRNAEEIVSHGEVDAVLLGPRDLSVDIGVPGEFDHPEIEGAADKLRSLGSRHGKPYGTMARDLETTSGWSDELRLISLGAILRPAARILREEKQS